MSVRTVRSQSAPLSVEIELKEIPENKSIVKMLAEKKRQMEDSKLLEYEVALSKVQSINDQLHSRLLEVANLLKAFNFTPQKLPAGWVAAPLSKYETTIKLLDRFDLETKKVKLLEECVLLNKDLQQAQREANAARAALEKLGITLKSNSSFV